MNYIENIYVCLAAPLLVAVLCLRGSRRSHTLFLLGGMTACILSSYASTYLVNVILANPVTAVTEVAPIVEEVMKFVPVLFYLIVFEPPREEIIENVLMVSIGFATFENVCYLTGSGSEHFLRILIRGFGTGTMHVVCGAIISFGLVYLWDRSWLRVVGTVGLLTVSITYHAVFNVLVSQTGAPAAVGYSISLLIVILVVVVGRTISKRRGNPAEKSV